MSISDIEAGNATNTAVDALIKAGPGALIGLLANSSSSGTATIYDNVEASGKKISNALPLTAGQFVRIPAGFATGCYLDIGGTADVTVFWL
jgi:hypothetical protein